MCAPRGRCIKLRFLALVVVTAHCINELTTPKTGITHSLIAPSAIVSTYIFIGIFMIASLWDKYPSWFLEIYGFVVCISVQIAHAVIVFQGLKKHRLMEMAGNAALILNAVLPCLVAMLLIIDLVITFLSLRSSYVQPPVPSQELVTN